MWEITFDEFYYRIINPINKQELAFKTLEAAHRWLDFRKYPYSEVKPYNYFKNTKCCRSKF